MAQQHMWIWFLCLQTWSEAAGRDADSHLVDGILGESVTFSLNIQEPQNVKNIAWTSKSSVAFVKPRLQGEPPDVIVTQAAYEGRIDVIKQNYDLIIKNLRTEDAGTYKADINIENTPTITKHYHLHIYRRLGKPTITQNLITFVNNSCNVTLTCSVEKEEEDVTYSWSPFGERSNVLQIFQSPEDQKLNYTCTVQNPVSNSSNSVTAQELCTDISSFYVRHAVLPSGLAVALPLLVLIPFSVFLFYFYKRRHNGTDLEGDVSKETAYSEVSRNAHPMESRIYDEIPEAKVLPRKEEPMSTIYSSVQPSEKVWKNNTKDDRRPKTLGNEIIV
ncbi:SLAM family member 5 isoform X1 [Alexandromys fortis]|uniref:SLAM family member 5 isoform X1 n=1 Tax=Alexandromys fortis TaxID=100897 RepID=UPI0021534CFC|nr:SLAM family member 5 isoform X1 [Microtus fortis]